MVERRTVGADKARMVRIVAGDDNVALTYDPPQAGGAAEAAGATSRVNKITNPMMGKNFFTVSSY